MLFNDQGTTRPSLVLGGQPTRSCANFRPDPGSVGGTAPRADRAGGRTARRRLAGLGGVADLRSDDRAPAFFSATLELPCTLRCGDRGVDRAQAAWGRRVALLVSRHGSVIYERFSDRHRSSSAEADKQDGRAAQDYLRRHRSLQESWVRVLGLDADAVSRESDLLAFADTLSLILCGALPMPPMIEGRGTNH